MKVFPAAHAGPVLAILGAIVALIVVFGIVKASPPVKPLVYLMPADFMGPVFVFFGQKDGVDVIPDPLGNALVVPRNGVVKLKGTVDGVISSDRSARNLYWVSLSKKDERKVLWIVNALRKDDDGEWIYSYFDESGKLHEAKGPSPGGWFEHIPESRRNDRMVMSNGGCKHQRFAAWKAPDARSPDRS